jgi:CRISPR-associated endonuclease Cas3-HD
MINELLAWHNESLRNHLLNVAENSKKLASVLKLNMEKQAFLAGFLHDIGKADDGAQNRLRRFVGVGGHEILSYVVAYNLLKEIIDAENRFIVLMAILRHHQAMADFNERFEQMMQWFSGRVSALKELELIISEGFIRLNYKLSTGQLLWPKKENIKNMLHDAQRDIHSFVKDDEMMLKVSLRARILAAVVMMADTYVASKRGNKGGRYREEVIHFFKIYDKLYDQFLELAN